MKTCKQCQAEKLLEAFERWSKPSGATGYRAVCRACREASRKPDRASYRVANKDKIKVYATEWRDGNREKYREMHQRWRDGNRDKVRESHKRHHQANQTSRVLKARRREAEELRAVPSWADHEKIREVYELAKEFRAAGFDVHVDHIVPLRGREVSGLHWHGNLRICLASVNLRKSNKLVEL